MNSNGNGSNGAVSMQNGNGKQPTLLQEVGHILSDYLESQNDITTKTVELKSPEEIEEAMKNEAISISLDYQQASSQEELVAATKAILKYSVRTAHPLFFNQLYGRAEGPGIAGDWIVTSANTSVVTHEVAPVFQLIEKEVIRKMGSVVGGKFAEQTEGLFVPGGSISNLYAMHLARNRAAPSILTEGAHSAPPLAAFSSTHAHYSYKKMSQVMGIGSNNLYMIPTDARGRMLPAELRKAMQAAKDGGKLPFFVGLTVGSTVMGAVDPVEECLSIAREFGAWVHVDSAWGGGLFLKDGGKQEVKGVGDVDSLAWNAHKMMGLPQQCSAFLCRHQGQLIKTNGLQAAYLFQPDKLFANTDIGDSTIQCGRKADSVKLWMQWKALGDQGLRDRMNRNFEIADYFYQQLLANPDVFLPVIQPSCTNVCFWVVPPSMRPFNRQEATKEELDRLGLIAPSIKAQMQKEGDALIGYQPLDEHPNFFRIVFSNTRQLTEKNVDELLSRMAKYSEIADVEVEPLKQKQLA